MKNKIEIVNLTKKYGNLEAVKDLSLSVKEGEIFGFIGPNGAGKSTTIRSIMNLVNKTSGKVLIDNKEFNKDDVDVKSKIGYLPSEIYLYEDLTVKEMLDYHASFYKKDLTKRKNDLVKKFELDQTKKIEDLSLGNLKKLGIVLALMHEPEILILDEPTSGLDPIMQKIFFETLKEEKEKGTTIIYSTHILSEVSKICDRVGIIKEGKLIKLESTKDIEKKNLEYVTIESDNCASIIKDLKIKPIIKEENKIRFINKIDYNFLIKTLANYDIKKILIEKMDLEDMFIHYYK